MIEADPSSSIGRLSVLVSSKQLFFNVLRFDLCLAVWRRGASYVDYHCIEGTGFVAGGTGNVSGSGEHMEHPKNPFPPKVIVTP